MDAQYPHSSGYEPEEELDEPDELNRLWREPGDPDGIVAAEEEWRRQQNRPDPPSPYVTYDTRRHAPKGLIITVLVVLGLIGAYMLGSWNARPKHVSQHTAQQAQTAAADTTYVPVKHYDSKAYTLGLDYPGNWAVSDTPNALTITSPNVNMTDVGGKTTGHVIVSIQNQQSSIPNYPADGGLANVASEQLTYRTPSSVQRGQTYLTYVAYKSPNGIDALYLTGDTAYKAAQQVPMADIIKGNPLVSVTFAKCGDSACRGSNVVPITLLASSWKSAAFKSQITDLLQSLTLN